MTWLKRLWQTYDKLLLNNNDSEEMPVPIAHVSQWSHINIIIDGEGNFKNASVNKARIHLPATEASSNRTGGLAPHALSDQLQYVANDYIVHANSDKAKTGFDAYQTQLKKWCDSSFSNPKVVAIYNYISKGTVVTDLINSGVVFVDSNGKYIEKWEDKENVPAIYSVLNKTAGKIDIRSALVAWTVEIPGDFVANIWEDATVADSWANYLASQDGQKNLCLVSGKECDVALMHPKNIRFPGDGAKLISSNDNSGYTFRGLFTDAEQAATIGAEVSQKAHSALRWLIANRGARNEDQFTVVWAISGKPVINPLEDFAFLEEIVTDEGIDHANDLGASAASKVKKLILGYKAELSDTDQLSLICVDAATTGRAAITYYKEFSPDDYFNTLLAWQEDLMWTQRCVIKVKNSKGKEVNQTIYQVMAPSVFHIAQAIYGKFLSTSLKKNVYARLLPCITEQRPIPIDLVKTSFQQACNPFGCDDWEWERNIGIACSLYKGFMARHPDKTKRRTYSMSIDESCVSRDYLYGRLLAIAEKLEDVALRIGGENRQTTAVRYIQQFAQRPFTTWRNIELALTPYKNKLRGRRAGFLVNKEKELDEIMNKFDRAEFVTDNPLSGEFLLGYHAQKMAYRTEKTESATEDSIVDI